MLLCYLQSCISVSQPIFREKVRKRGFHFFYICVEKNVFLMLNEKTEVKMQMSTNSCINRHIYKTHSIQFMCMIMKF